MQIIIKQFSRKGKRGDGLLSYKWLYQIDGEYWIEMDGLFIWDYIWVSGNLLFCYIFVFAARPFARHKSVLLQFIKVKIDLKSIE